MALIAAPAPAPAHLSHTNTHASLLNSRQVQQPSTQTNSRRSGAAVNSTSRPTASKTGDVSPEQEELTRARSEKEEFSQQSRPHIVRRRTDAEPERHAPIQSLSETEAGELRHGWEDQYNSSEFLSILTSNFYMYFTDKRHESGGKPKEEPFATPPENWRDKGREKTISAALVLCLNIGVDPPDIMKTNPTATMECWTNTAAWTVTNNKLMEMIGKKLQDQYETLAMKVRYKQYLDPSLDETKKFCQSLRRSAKEERVLFHYNGHGVPRPTPSGEFWVFNRDYTQYIPVSMYDLQAWLGGPSIFVYDVSHAGHIVANFDRFIEKHEAENAEERRHNPEVQLPVYSNNIQLAACGKDEILPTNPDLPADLFTACLTSPVIMSLKFHILQNPWINVSLEDVLKTPGKTTERRSAMGELNWILTAVTDTIAWNVLPPHLFKILFRQDLMIAALFRNFLVAQRIMRHYGCHPISTPAIPSTHGHALWESWDMAIAMVLSQLPQLLAAEEGGPPYEYQGSTFFTEQLTAFEVDIIQNGPRQQAPTQLPVVLQVLLSQIHRLKALILLSKFLDLGPWAVSMALTVGIFPYVVKLLQSPALELRPIMIFIWARIIAVDPKTIQADLLKDSGYKYFVNTLLTDAGIPVVNATEHKAMAAFVIAMFCRNYRQGQAVCASPELFDACIANLQDPENSLLRQWTCLCISMLWEDNVDAKWAGIRCFAHHHLCALTVDPIPEVRAAAVHALTNFLGIPDLTPQVTQYEENIACALMTMTMDGNAMVRKELLVFFSVFVKRYQNKFLVAAYETLVEERENVLQSSYGQSSGKSNAFGTLSNGIGQNPESKVSVDSVQGSLWLHILVLSVDPHPEVSQAAETIVNYTYETLLESPLGPPAQQVIENITALGKSSSNASRQNSAAPTSRTPQAPTSVGSQVNPKSEGSVSGLRRNASVAAALKLFGLGGSTSTDNLQPAPSNSQQTADQIRLSGPQRIGIPPEWSTPPTQNDNLQPPARYQKARVPLPKGYKKQTETESSRLPLKSAFFDWAIEYFREPQMKPTEQDEPGSEEYNSRLWRRIRNEKTLAETQPLKAIAGSSQWDVPTAFFNNGSQPVKMCFHQYEDHLAIADDRDSISIFNFQNSQRLSRFSNANPKGSRINEARFINEDDQALLMTGSSDGIIKIFRNYESENEVQLVTAFRALTDLIPSTKNAGLVLDWQQGQGKLLVAGDVKVIRVWNSATEICTNDIPARSGSCITSLTSDQVAGDIFCAGYGDGAIRIFDTREKPQTAMVRMWRRHKQWITNVHMQRGGFRELVSGSRNGEVKLWDIRRDEPIREITATADTLRTLSVHEHAPVFATGTDTNKVTIFNVNGAPINTLHPYTPSLITGKSDPVASTAFHPHRMLLATSSLGHGNVGIFQCSKT